MNIIIALLASVIFILSEKSSAAEYPDLPDGFCECGIANEARVRRSQIGHGYWFNRGAFNQEKANLPGSSRIRRGANRIVGGWEAKKNKYPWLVSIVMMRGPMRSQCGGAIINTHHILTAGHCTYAGMCTNPYEAKDIYVTVADHNIYAFNDDVKGVTQTFQVQQIIRHPEYCVDPKSLTSYNNDVAIFILPNHLDLSHKELGLPCLPDHTWSTFEGETVTVAGWGLNQPSGAIAGKTATNLLEVDIKVLNDCRGYKHGHHLTSNMLCAGDTEKVRDACGGDSGGPLMYKNKNSKYIQVGIVSFGPPGGNCTGLGVYTAVAHYINWIRENTKDGLCEI